MLIKEAIRKGMISLKTNNIQEPNLKSRLLMQYILNKPRQYLLIHDNEELTNKEKIYEAEKEVEDGAEPILVDSAIERLNKKYYG